MRKSFVLIIMLLTINSSLALETTTNNMVSPAKDYYKINKSLAHKILKNFPEYPILYYPTIVAEAKYRFQLIRPILIHIALNLVIRSFFGLGYNSQMVYSTLGFLIINTVLTIANPAIDKEIITRIIAIFLQLSAEISISLYTIADSYDIMLLTENRSILAIITMILFPITSYNIISNLYEIVKSKKIFSSNIRNPRLILLNSIIKKNTPMYLYSKEDYLQISQDDSLFTRINNWVAGHKDDISLYNLYCIHAQHLISQKEFVENNPIIEKTNNYYIMNSGNNSCTNLKTGLKFIRQPSANAMNKYDIEYLLDNQGHYIIEASKNIENFDITKDLLNDRHQYIVIIDKLA